MTKYGTPVLRVDAATTPTPTIAPAPVARRDPGTRLLKNLEAIRPALAIRAARAVPS